MGCVICKTPSSVVLKEAEGSAWYCAYGSNMSRDRITKRITSHEIRGNPLIVQFKAKRLVFNKQSLTDVREGFANLEDSYGGLLAEAVI